jgi:phage replication-related protein YjqB (UPF0714/DUF867 family)
MSSEYTSYQQLRNNHEEDKDYKISESCVRSRICVFSPHGGGIEPGISELVREIAGDDFSWYLFEGTQRSHNWDLHIKSQLFDEPKAVRFVQHYPVALAIHGECDADSEATYLGGRDIQRRQHVGDFLRQAGFKVPKQTPRSLVGTDPNNICNRCISGEGIQLEITRRQRQRFFCGDFRKLAGRRHRTVIFREYVDAVRAALRELNEELTPSNIIEIV